MLCSSDAVLSSLFTVTFFPPESPASLTNRRSLSFSSAFRSPVNRWSHGVEWRSPVTIRAQTRSTAPGRTVPAKDRYPLGAVVAYVADILKVPAIFIKAVTNVVDGDKPSIVKYRQNLATMTAALGLAETEVVDFINGKCLSEL